MNLSRDGHFGHLQLEKKLILFNQTYFILPRDFSFLFLIFFTKPNPKFQK